MSTANPRPGVQLELTGFEFKIVTRALLGDLKKSQEFSEGRKLGIQLLEQYLRSERDRIQRLGDVLEGFQKTSGDQEAIVGLSRSPS